MSSAALRDRLDPLLSSHLLPMARLRERRAAAPTGIGVLDVVLGGGWPRGALCELTGRASSGRTSLVCASLAAAQARGEVVCLVDSGGVIDPRSVAAAGVALDRLLWVGAEGRQALQAADLLVGAGGMGLVVLDLGDDRRRPARGESRTDHAGGHRSHGRPGDNAWIRLGRAAAAHGTVMLVSTPAPRLGSFAAAAVDLERGGGHFASARPTPPLLLGLEARAVVRRVRHRPDPPPAQRPRLHFQIP